MTDTIPKRPRTLVGSHPNRKPLEGREAVERALRFCRSHKTRCAADWASPIRTYPPPRVDPHIEAPEGWQEWLGPAATLDVFRLEALLNNHFVLHEGRLLHLEGDALVSIELELSPDEPNSLEMPDGSHL